jgi:tetratricopeptide (TPR) repeat protein
VGIVALFLAHFAVAAVDPFYLGLYQRGMTLFEAGDFASASREFRLAAFGLVDSLEQFETAHIYAAVSASKAGRTDDAKVSVERIINAERVTRTYSHLVIAAPVRTEFEAIAKGAVTPAAYAFLTMPDAPPPPRATPRVVVQVPPSLPRGASPASSAPTSSNGGHAAGDPPEKARPVTTPSVSPPSTPHSAQPPSEAESDLSKSLAAAERAVATGDLAKARAIYAAQLEGPGLSHSDLLRIGAGLYRSRDFSRAVSAFIRAGEPTEGEEINHYYFAVSLYESGQYGAAKRELLAAMPYVEKTPDVKRYQAKIERAVVE